MTRRHCTSETCASTSAKPWLEYHKILNVVNRKYKQRTNTFYFRRTGTKIKSRVNSLSQIRMHLGLLSHTAKLCCWQPRWHDWYICACVRTYVCVCYMYNDNNLNKSTLTRRHCTSETCASTSGIWQTLNVASFKKFKWTHHHSSQYVPTNIFHYYYHQPPNG